MTGPREPGWYQVRLKETWFLARLSFAGEWWVEGRMPYRTKDLAEIGTRILLPRTAGDH
jgi:hypothetical protein